MDEPISETQWGVGERINQSFDRFIYMMKGQRVESFRASKAWSTVVHVIANMINVYHI